MLYCGILEHRTKNEVSLMSIELLTHVSRPLPHGGEVLILNTGAVITPEDEAMLQALHSRSIGGIREHLGKLAKSGSGKFMGGFYVNYGHKSIGDCGSGSVFIEGVSMLVAKAVQDSMLYSGQESSTRYIDFATQRFADPVGTRASEDILETWRAFYVAAQEPLKRHVREQFPQTDEEKESVYEKAIAARVFDITRGFLPSGATTNLAWHTNLRQFADRCAILRHHPLAEVREVADALLEALAEAFPNSFGHKRYEATEEYNRWWMQNHYYFTQERWPDFALAHDGVDHALLATHRDIFNKRPQKTELPKFVAEAGTVRFDFLLDFGSFRDIQRQRSVVQRMPLVTMRHSFEPWYLNELPEGLREQARVLLETQKKRTEKLVASPEVMQYYIAMGYRLPNRVSGDLSALVYVAELRSASTVHPTLQIRARQIADTLEREFGSYGLTLHIDRDPGRFDVKRGTHDIVEKQ